MTDGSRFFKTVFLSLFLLPILFFNPLQAKDLKEFYKVQDKFQKLLYEEQNFQEALAIEDKYLQIAKEQLADQPYKKLARVYADLAILNGEVANYETAINYWDEILKVYKKHNDKKNYLNSLTNRGIVYEKISKFYEALRDHKESINIAEEYYGSNARELLAPLNNYGMVLAAVGDHSQSINYYLRSLEIEESFDPDSLNIATISLNLGVSFSYLKKYELAEHYYYRALEIDDKHNGPYTINAAQILASLGNVRRAQKDFEQAEWLLSKSLEIREVVLGTDHPDTLTSELHIAGLLAHQKNYRKAITIVEEVSRKFSDLYGEDHIRNLANHLNLSNWYQFEHNLKKASEHSEKSLKIGENILSPFDPELAKVYESIASVNLLLTQDSSIKNSIEPSLTQGKFLSKHMMFTEKAADIMSYHINQFKKDNSLYKNEEYEDFIINYITALNSYNSSYGSQLFLTERYKRGFNIEFGSEISLNNFEGIRVTNVIENSPAYKAGLRSEDLITQVNKTQISDPIKFYETITDFLPGSRVKLEIKRVDKIFKIEFVNELVIPEWKRKKDEKIITSKMWIGKDDKESIDETFKFYQTLYDIDASKALKQSISRIDSGLYEDRIKEMQNAALENLEITKKKISRIQEYNTSVDVMRLENEKFSENVKKINQIESELRVEYPKYFELVSPEVYSISDIQNLLSEDEALITYLYSTGLMYGYFNMSYTHIWVITKNDQRVYFIDELPPEILLANIQEMSEMLNPYNHLEFDFDVSYNLYEKIFLPIEDYISDKKEIYIVPYGDLYKIPFSTFITEENYTGTYKNAPWLIHKFAFTTLPSLAILELIKNNKEKEQLKSHIGFGDPILANYQSDQYRGYIENIDDIKEFISLPETRSELEAISKFLGEEYGTNYFGEDATETKIKNMDLSNASVISFATHALVSGELKNLNEPGLILTPPEEPSIIDDGVLTASEITKLDLSNTDFVILSACNTTAGSDSNAEELSGLSRSFFYSGAKSILASHWPVVSEVAPLLTVGIFKNLVESKHTISKAEAMRRSLLDYINNSDEQILHPSFWGVFSLIGG